MLGPHHSGTSIVAKALDLTGFYLGEAKDLLHRSMCMRGLLCCTPAHVHEYVRATLLHGVVHGVMHGDARHGALGHAPCHSPCHAPSHGLWCSSQPPPRSPIPPPPPLSLSGHRRLREDNPLKYWERRDAVEINKARIGTAQGGGNGAVPSFVGYGFEPAQGSPLDPSPVIAALDGSGRSWATKDPRLSLTASEWLPHLTTDRTRPPPVRPLVYRPASARNHTALHRPARLPSGVEGPRACLYSPRRQPVARPHKMSTLPSDHTNRCAC